MSDVLGEDLARLAARAHVPPLDLAAVERVAAGRRRRRRLLAVATTSLAAASALVAGPIVAARVQAPQPQDRLEIAAPALEVQCPPAVRRDEPLAPPAPPTGVQAGGRLVPEQTPVAVDICRYTQEGALVGKRRLTGNLAQVAGDLAVPVGDVASRNCPAVLGPSLPYLAALSYPGGGRVWLITSTDLCSTVTNGQVLSPEPVADLLVQSYDAGSWTPGQTSSGAGVCSASLGGRAGQELQLVPEGWTTARVCQAWLGTPGADDVGRELKPAAARQTAAQVNALPTKRSTSSCANHLEAPSPAAPFVLRFDYPTGRAVFVAVNPDCNPPIDNYYLAADLTDQQLAELIATVRP